MLRVHLADGRTLRFDLDDERQAAKWSEHARDYSFQAAITGLTVQHNGVQYSLPRPNGFHRVWLFAELLSPIEQERFKGGERLICHADEVRVSLMAHAAQKAARIGLTKVGKVVYNPKAEK